MTKNKWDAEPWIESPKVQEIEETNEIPPSIIDPGNCIVPPPRLSINESEAIAQDDGWGSVKSISAIFYSKKSRVEDLIERVSQELNIAHSRKYDAVQAELTAALTLEAQKELSEFLSDAELISKEKKAEVERVEAERYFFYKADKTEKTEKITDIALNRLVAKD